MTGRYKDTQGFFIFGLMPLIIGWGIYYIWYEDVKRKKINLFKNSFTATSFAAFKILGALPPVCKACLAKFKAGNLELSGW